MNADRHHLRIGDVLLGLEEAEEMLSAIHAGKIDAVMVEGTAGHEILTFRDPSHPYRLLVEAMAEGAALTTTEGVICYHNSWFGQVVGAAGMSLSGSSLSELVGPGQRLVLDRLLERARSAPPARGEIGFMGHDGRGVLVQLSITPAFLADVAVFCVVMTDLSEHRRQEELYRGAREEIEARDRLFSVAEHELRGPLNTLDLQTHLLMRLLEGEDKSWPREKAVAIVGAIERQSKLLAELVNKLMDVGSIGSDRFSLSTEIVDLAEVVRAAVERSSEWIRSSGSSMTLDVSSVCGRWDRVRIEQVVTNLLSNALKYGLGNPIHIAVGHANRTARLVVEDQGRGIPPEARERIFRAYERMASAEPQPGLGLGLFITAEIVKAHGGTIRVDGAPGGGSRFLVDLPLNTPA